jgi:hypothetical protein
MASAIEARLAGKVERLPSLAGELAYKVVRGDLAAVCRTLRDAEDLRFEMLIDVAGIDYLHYGESEWKTLESTATGFSRGVERGVDETMPLHGTAHPGAGRSTSSFRLRTTCGCDCVPIARPASRR